MNTISLIKDSYQKLSNRLYLKKLKRMGFTEGQLRTAGIAFKRLSLAVNSVDSNNAALLNGLLDDIHVNISSLIRVSEKSINEEVSQLSHKLTEVILTKLYDFTAILEASMVHVLIELDKAHKAMSDQQEVTNIEEIRKEVDNAIKKLNMDE